MLKTRICELFGIDYPIISAGMGGVAFAELAAAVSEAGGLGTLGLVGFTPNGIRNEVRKARESTSKPLAANLIVPFMRADQLEVLAACPIAAATFFWGDAREHSAALEVMHKSGIKVIWQCGSAEEARNAKAAGVDVIIAQGFEAGGHVRGVVTTLALIPDVRDTIGDMPLVAAGGIADGRGLAAALALGADGVAIGTRFVASVEASAHAQYKQRLVSGTAAETLHTTLFDDGWPDAPMRVLRSKTVQEWEQAGCPPRGKRPGEGQIIGRVKRAEFEFGPEVTKYGGFPTDYFEGDIESCGFLAGQSVSLVREILPAGEIVRRLVNEAVEVIDQRLKQLTH
jgi:NAD(P)H-dependent flavin oxidoreductase YrpB (nitropropane dioxygenase family)